MRTLTFKCAISSTMVSFIDLKDQQVPLLQNGTMWSGSLPVDVDDTLNIAYTVTGITGSPWTVDITIDCPGSSPAKIFSSSGNIPHGGSEGHTTSAKVPANPCAPKMQLAKAEVEIAPVKVAAKAKSTPAKAAKAKKVSAAKKATKAKKASTPKKTKPARKIRRP